MIVEAQKWNDLSSMPKVVVYLGRDQSPPWLTTKNHAQLFKAIEKIGDLDESITSSLDWNNPEQR